MRAPTLVFAQLLGSRSRALFIASCAVTVALPGGACSSVDEPPPHWGVDPASGGSLLPGKGSGGTSGDDCEPPPQPDGNNLCGNQLVPVVHGKPNLYFVLDASGSMSAPMGDGTGSRMAVAKSAMVNMLHELGHRINYGLAVYPGGADECGAGEEVFPTREGDPVQCVNRRVAGPELSAFAKKLATVTALGGTPIASTLTGLQPTITALEGSTSVILVTDGAPNCNVDDVCAPSDCMYNIEGASHGGKLCDEQLNCCDPAQTGIPYININCVDRDPTVQAVAQLAAAGVKTYVIGVPGSEFYADLLDQLAVAGGTARTGEERAYYPVRDTRALSQALKLIGTTISATCEIPLKSNVRVTDLNVYFDSKLIPSSPDDGWTYDAPLIRFSGPACDALLSGEVYEVQMVSGCPTIVR